MGKTPDVPGSSSTRRPETEVTGVNVCLERVPIPPKSLRFVRKVTNIDYIKQSRDGSVCWGNLSRHRLQNCRLFSFVLFNLGRPKWYKA